MDKIAAIVLASGKAMRFKSNKLLYEVNSKALIHYAIDNVSRSNFQQRIIVLRNNEISDYSKQSGYQVVWNEDFEDGMSTSIVHGIENVSPEIEAAMIIPGDMPLLDNSILNGLIEHFKSSGKGISGFEYNGTIISPVIFTRKYFTELKGLRGDKGAKSIIVKHHDDFSPMIISGDLLIDIDTMDDALKFKNLIEHKN